MDGYSIEEKHSPGKKSKCYPIGTWAKLENGKIVHYDLCDEIDECPVLEKVAYKYEYLGKGIIYAIHGIFQGDTETLHFWKRNNSKSQVYSERRETSSASAGGKFITTRVI